MDDADATARLLPLRPTNLAPAEFVRAVHDQLGPATLIPLDADGFGLSDACAPLRRHLGSRPPTWWSRPCTD